jgi:ABC-type sulfate transport system permease component
MFFVFLLVYLVYHLAVGIALGVVLIRYNVFRTLRNTETMGVGIAFSPMGIALTLYFFSY